jgi:hypothetical protein
MPARPYESLKIALLVIVFTAAVVALLYFALRSDPTSELDAIHARIMAEYEAEEAARTAEREARQRAEAGTGGDGGGQAEPVPTSTPEAVGAPVAAPSDPIPTPRLVAMPEPTPEPEQAPEPELEPTQLTMISATLDTRGSSVVTHAYVAVSKPDSSAPDGASILDWSEVPVFGDETTATFRVGPLEAPPQPLYALIAVDRDGGIYASERLFPGDPPAEGAHLIDLGRLVRRPPTALHLELEGEGPGAAAYEIILRRPDEATGARLADELAVAAFLLTSPPTLGQYAGFSPARAQAGSIIHLAPLYPDDAVEIELRPAGAGADQAMTKTVPLVPHGDQHVTVDLDNLFASEAMIYADLELTIVTAGAGAPLAGAIVRWADGSSRQQWVSGADGRVAIPEVEIGAKLLFRVLAPGDPTEANGVEVAIQPRRTPLVDKTSPAGAEGLRLPAEEGGMLVWQETVPVRTIP